MNYKLLYRFKLVFQYAHSHKKQGDEHIYILLQISIIDCVSVRYVDILRFVRMLFGSEITYGDALSILYEVHVKGNHADGDKVLQKKSCHEITPAAAKARSAQVLRNSPRAHYEMQTNRDFTLIRWSLIRVCS